MLDNRQTPYTISKELDKSPSTIIREIEKHSKITPMKNDCVNYATCKKKKLFNIYMCRFCNKFCKSCDKKECIKYCPDYTKMECEYITGSPHVCNGCDKIRSCKLEHRIIFCRISSKRI